jgi:methyltransferase family protein
MTETIEKIKEKISAINIDEKVFKGIDLTYEQQLYERGKPKKYLELTVELFKAIHGTTIIEIGCMRTPLVHSITKLNPPCCNEGHSTIFWCMSGADVVSVDISKQAVKTAKKYCKKYKNCKIIRGDGIRFLEKYKKSIDLLYLDAWDIEPGIDYAENHLLAYLKAKPKLNKTNIIAIDDTDIGQGGKGRLLIPVLNAEGYQILVQGRQTIALMENV